MYSISSVLDGTEDHAHFEESESPYTNISDDVLWFCEYDQEKPHAALVFYLVWSRKYGTYTEAILPLYIARMELSLTCLPDNIESIHPVFVHF
jgi:hypothetical protein